MITQGGSAYIAQGASAPMLSDVDVTLTGLTATGNSAKYLGAGELSH